MYSFINVHFYKIVKSVVNPNPSELTIGRIFSPNLSMLHNSKETGG